mmetsp:Transcript_79098/g.183542  ORF Transcript_79098/g.183542 Transcript_79098/m.183542 type:complete len:255 (+) Transcript_79098:628-1392(+)
MEGEVEIGVVHCCKELPDLLVLVNRPLAERVLVDISIREWILVVKHAVVPGKQGHDEQLVTYRCGCHINAHVITRFKDGVQLHNGVAVGAHLWHCDPHLVASRCVKHTPELGFEHPKSAADLVESVRNIPSDNQHIILELEPINAVYPLFVDPNVKVHVRTPKDPRGALWPPLVHVEPPLASSCWPRAHAQGLHQARVHAFTGKGEVSVHLDHVEKHGVGLLTLAASQERHTQTAVCFGRVLVCLHRLLGIGDG